MVLLKMCKGFSVFIVNGKLVIFDVLVISLPNNCAT